MPSHGVHFRLTYTRSDILDDVVLYRVYIILEDFILSQEWILVYFKIVAIPSLVICTVNLNLQSSC